MDYSFLEEKLKEALYFSPQKKKAKKILFSFLIFVLLFSTAFFFFQENFIHFFQKNKIQEAKANIFLAKKQEKKTLSSPSQTLKKRLNILLLGIPGPPWPAPYLTDSIEVISISPENSFILVIGIPRDLLVKIPGSNYETRINALYYLSGNTKTLEKKIEEITGLKIDFYVILDLKTLREIIDILGGIKIEVKENIYDPHFPTPSRGTETFSLKKGVYKLNGDEVIKYIRTRNFPEGDFARISHQQQVMEAIRKKIFKLNLLADFDKILKIYKKLKGKTNVSLKDLKNILSLAKNLKEKKVKYLILEAGKKDSLLLYGKTILGGKIASVLWPKAGKFNYSEIKMKIKKLLKNK